MRDIFHTVLGLLCLTAVAACDKAHEAGTAPVAVPPMAAAETAGAKPPGANSATQTPSDAANQAKALYAQRCTLCHGLEGRGNGPAAASLSPRPRNYGEAAWQASVKDEDLRKVIVEGGAAVGKSMMMPPNPDLQTKPEIVAELVKIIRSFKR